MLGRVAGWSSISGGLARPEQEGKVLWVESCELTFLSSVPQGVGSGDQVKEEDSSRAGRLGELRLMGRGRWEVTPEATQ